MILPVLFPATWNRLFISGVLVMFLGVYLTTKLMRRFWTLPMSPTDLFDDITGQAEEMGGLSGSQTATHLTIDGEHDSQSVVMAVAVDRAPVMAEIRVDLPPSLHAGRLPALGAARADPADAAQLVGLLEMRAALATSQAQTARIAAAKVKHVSVSG